MLRTTGLTQRHGSRTAPKSLTTALRAGLFVALRCPNGTGKSTLFQVLTGLFAADEGDVEVARASAGEVGLRRAAAHRCGVPAVRARPRPRHPEKYAFYCLFERVAAGVADAFRAHPAARDVADTMNLVMPPMHSMSTALCALRKLPASGADWLYRLALGGKAPGRAPWVVLGSQTKRGGGSP